jgi:hypothetical protein
MGCWDHEGPSALTRRFHHLLFVFLARAFLAVMW